MDGFCDHRTRMASPFRVTRFDRATEGFGGSYESSLHGRGVLPIECDLHNRLLFVGTLKYLIGLQLQASQSYFGGEVIQRFNNLHRAPVYVLYAETQCHRFTNSEKHLVRVLRTFVLKLLVLMSKPLCYRTEPVRE